MDKRFRDHLKDHPGVPVAAMMSLFTVLAVAKGPGDIERACLAGALTLLWWVPVLWTAWFDSREKRDI